MFHDCQQLPMFINPDEVTYQNLPTLRMSHQILPPPTVMTMILIRMVTLGFDYHYRKKLWPKRIYQGLIPRVPWATGYGPKFWIRL
jgi:hypothetical protein